MLFMVISTPRPEQPSSLRSSQSGWWDWIRPLERSGVAKAVYIKVGRGGIVVFDVDSNEALHTLVNQWSEFIAAEFLVIPLAERQYQEGIARAGARKRAPNAERASRAADTPAHRRSRSRPDAPTPSSTRRGKRH